MKPFLRSLLLAALGAAVGCQAEPPSAASAGPAPVCVGPAIREDPRAGRRGPVLSRPAAGLETRRRPAAGRRARGARQEPPRPGMSPCGLRVLRPGRGHRLQATGRPAFLERDSARPQPLCGIHGRLRIDRRRLPDAAGIDSAFAQGGRDGQGRAVFGPSRRVASSGPAGGASRRWPPCRSVPTRPKPGSIRWKFNCRCLQTAAPRRQHRAGGVRTSRAAEGGREAHSLSR